MSLFPPYTLLTSLCKIQMGAASEFQPMPNDLSSFGFSIKLDGLH
jgi:hypothetical protein